MVSGDGDKLNRIEELKSKLFSKSYKTKVEHRDNFTPLETKDVPDVWRTSGRVAQDLGEKFFIKTSLFKKFFIFSVGFFILAVGYASYMFFVESNTVSNNNIDISILGNAFTAGGEELPLQIGITNRNTSALELVDLVVEYPKNSEVNLGSETERIRESLGTIPPGVIRNENVRVVLFGEQGSIRPIKISIEYRVEGSNAIFVKEKSYEVTINSTPINLSLDLPTSVSPNQNMTLKVKATLNATRPAAKMLLRLDYPVGFQFTKATPAPSFGNNIWDLGDLAPGADKNIYVEGKILDVFDGEEKTFHVWSGSQSAADKSTIGTVFNSLKQTVVIKKPLIEAKFFIDGASQREYSSYSGTPINAEVRFTNNLDTKISDLEIRAKISGNAVNRKTIFAKQGFYNSSEDVIIWDKNSISRFKEIDPGDSGSVSFSISSLSLFSASSGMLANPSINIDVDISGQQTLAGYESKDLGNKESSVIKIISDTGLAAKALYFSGPFKNTGAIPPKAEEETTYTVAWSLSNTANNISKASVRSTLPPWINFAGKFSPSSEDLIYNSSTKEIIWNIGNIPRGTGITTTGKEVSFVVTFIPSLSQVNTIPVIINDATLTGHDDFANLDIRVNKASLNTRLVNDSAFPSNGDRVVE
ncbi:hypothetical protein A3C67_01150 [Candidatus Nomurabacteria bacterium RIFCSPHIGHO2_02_FULL_42_19]|uniref:DUF11 domain-containing protein n=1 Tax=Candidatus Nomurabacteria bacterium RIFCSPHIGHO2_02_FULL_42_19 TaxID=1801756 RepID=A0A1F6W222_9BACT|nr:MAG: hypothetical protein A3C67_01150 [Candidatus Nomurabacteria bacterium RIFCSPHIGHO2_02_FULL_42_19]